MKLSCVLSVALLLVLAPQATAWGVHEDITEIAYEALPENLKSLLVFSEMVGGVRAPDFEWKDFQLHRFPEGYQQAVNALERAREYYERAQYADASFWLGAGAHYIQDMVCLPHCVYGETMDQHTYFETYVARTLEVATPSRLENFDLYRELQAYVNAAQQKWEDWLATENKAYVQEGLDLAALLTYNAWIETLEDVTPLAELVGLEVWVSAGVVLLISCVLVVRARRKPGPAVN